MAIPDSALRSAAWPALQPCTWPPKVSKPFILFCRSSAIFTGYSIWSPQLSHSSSIASSSQRDHELRGMRAAACLAEACKLALHSSIQPLLASEWQSAAVQQLLNLQDASLHSVHNVSWSVSHCLCSVGYHLPTQVQSIPVIDTNTVIAGLEHQASLSWNNLSSTHAQRPSGMPNCVHGIIGFAFSTPPTHIFFYLFLASA